MASSSQVFVLTSIAAALLQSSMAIEHIVGEDKGWTVNFNYSAWAKDKVFYLGDTLVFNYLPGEQDVVKVDGAGFASCSAPANSVPFTTGHDVIPLKTPGKMWFICGVADHCARMQKLVIQVMAMEVPAPDPWATPPPPAFAPPAMEVPTPAPWATPPPQLMHRRLGKFRRQRLHPHILLCFKIMKRF